jgi:hypothetical protein
MLAKHPLTGNPIRVIKTSAQLWRDAKTLVLLSADVDSTVAWDRWETLAVGTQNIQSLREKGVKINISVFVDEPEMSLDDLKKQSEQAHLIAISMRIIQQVGAKAFQDAKIGNILCLDEFAQLYSYCGVAWNGTAEDAAALICATLHYSFLAGVSQESLTHRQERLDAMNIQCLGLHAKPQKLWLIQQYYRPEKSKRAREIRRCLEENVRCAFIDKIFLLNEDDFCSDFPKGSESKIVQKVVGKRLTYEMVIQTIYEDVPSDVIVVFANSDIFLGETTRLLWSMDLNNRFLSLLRWDVPEMDGEEPKIFGPRDDSQDTWIVTSNSVKARKWNFGDLRFPFGKNGCDNAINVEMLRQKFLIGNPAYSIRTFHVHASGYRTYNPQDIVDKPVFLHIAPTGLNDMFAKEKFDSKDILRKVDHKPFYRQLRSVQEKEIRTFCTMLKRGEEYEFAVDSKNLYSTEQNEVLGLSDCFLTHNGLPYGHHELLIGQSKLAHDMWSKTGIGGCQPCITSELALAAPLSPKELQSAESFCLRYVSKILQVRDIDGDFICPQNEDFLEVLRLFRWPRREVPVLPSDPGMGIYCKKAIIWEPSDKDALTIEDVAALRDGIRFPWHDFKPTSKKMTIIEDGQILDKKWIAELEEQIGETWDIHVIWPGRTSLERIVSLLTTTEVLVFANGEKLLKTWSWMWMLPEGAHSIEIQNEMDPRGDAIHMAGACELDSWLIIMRKGLREPMIKDTVKHTVATLDKMFSMKPVEGNPVVWIPRADIKGYFGHAGDSFREMAHMWGEKGFCEVKEHPVATLCWYNEKGRDIDDPASWLLYDRPNLDWLWTAPTVEQGWKQGLFGNPEPPKGGKAWSFWPRRPRLVETLVESGLPRREWKQRRAGPVFYGKIENRVQEVRRSAGDWSTVCEEFVMPKGADEKYPFSQEEYLVKLSEARFGLCLAGYGRKCHREVESMAMGCVPIVDKEVDMESFASPPTEGVHYLRVKTPEEVTEKIAGISEETWTRMSAACCDWWKNNASCRGMFLLTSVLAKA